MARHRTPLDTGELGLAPRDYLADPHPGVRACAALALADDAVATAEILAALEDPLAAAIERVGESSGFFPPRWRSPASRASTP